MSEKLFEQLMSELENEEEMKKRIQNIKDSFVVLTPLEKTILNVLVAFQSALTPAEIRETLIEAAWDYLTSPLENAKLSYWVPPYRVKKPLMRENLLKDSTWISETKDNEGSIAFDLLRLEKLKGEIPKFEWIEEVVRFLKKHDILQPPNYRTVENALNSLLGMGLVVFRKDESKKKKKMYAPHPLLLRVIR